MTYGYDKPRRFNLVTLFLLLVLAGGGYLGYKFLPVWWQGRKADEALDELKMGAVNAARLNDDARESVGVAIVNKAIVRLHELGIEDQVDQPVEVWFTPDFGELHARYQVIVTHPFGSLVKPTIVTMNRIVQVPK